MSPNFHQSSSNNKQTNVNEGKSIYMPKESSQQLNHLLTSPLYCDNSNEITTSKALRAPRFWCHSMIKVIQPKTNHVCTI